MPKRARLDAELVRRHLARSREHAATLITEGKVTVRGMVATKSATGVDSSESIVVRSGGDPGWASRGAHKLLGALAAFGPNGLSVPDKRCLDAGASTGGFTDVLLRHDARTVIAADVGRGLLDWRLRTDDRVVVLDKTNVRNLNPGQLGGEVDLIVSDLSFISLKLVLPALVACMGPDGDLVPMVKPQFEVGKDKLGSGGVVRDPGLRTEAVLGVLEAAADFGMRARGVVASPLPGPSGNVEYFLWLRRSDSESTVEITADVERLVHTAVLEGPQ